MILILFRGVIGALIIVFAWTDISGAPVILTVLGFALALFYGRCWLQKCRTGGGAPTVCYVRAIMGLLVVFFAWWPVNWAPIALTVLGGVLLILFSRTCL